MVWLCSQLWFHSNLYIMELLLWNVSSSFSPLFLVLIGKSKILNQIFVKMLKLVLCLSTQRNLLLKQPSTFCMGNWIILKVKHQWSIKACHLILVVRLTGHGVLIKGILLENVDYFHSPRHLEKGGSSTIITSTRKFVPSQVMNW